MKWAPMAIVAAALAMTMGPASVAGHSVPSRRSVVAQVDSTGVAVLVTWTSARGPQGAQMLARAAWGRSTRALPALRAMAGAEALRGLEITIDGVPVAPASVAVKVRVDRQSPARIVAAVLVTVPGASGVLRVRALTGPQTQLSWRDQTSGRARSDAAAGRWRSGRRTLRVDIARAPGG